MASAYVTLSDRGVVALRGPETRAFLQGIVSNDVSRVTPAQAIYAALLTPQGKFLFDFFIVEHAGDLLLEVERSRLPQLVQRLTMYRLRSKVEIEDASERLDVAVLFGDEIPAKLDLEAIPGACRGLADGVVFLDPRLPTLGARALLPGGQVETTLQALGLQPGSPEGYDELRLRQGVPDGSRDLVVEKSTLMESGFDELHGVDFKKGCFVGQELTARMKYRGLVRKRLMPVILKGPAPEPGTPILLDGREAGEMRSSSNGRGIALIRLEHLAKAEDKPLLAGETEVVPQKPEWANF